MQKRDAAFGNNSTARRFTSNRPGQIAVSAMSLAWVLMLVSLILTPLVFAQNTQTVDTRIGKLDFELGVPTQATVKNLYDQMDFQRACQLYIWALPLVEFGNLLDILEGITGAKPGDLTIYMRNEQSVFLTPNATTPYMTTSSGVLSVNV
jgi:hypothetical protein